MTDTAVFVPFLTAGGRVSASALAALSESGRVLEAKTRTSDPKVIRVSDSAGIPLIIKVWHPDELITSARLFPYNRRFKNNARKLQARGITAPLVRGWGSIGSNGTNFVCYEALPGRSLRESKPRVNLSGAGRYIAELHDAGIDFRSLHMGNIIEDDGHHFGLVDLTDCNFRRRPLPPKQRLKRLAYFCTHRRDQDYMRQVEHRAQLFDAYCAAVEAPDVSSWLRRDGQVCFQQQLLAREVAVKPLTHA